MARDGIPSWLLTMIASVTFLLWVAGWVAEFVSTLVGGDFRAPEGALSLLMLILGGTLAAGRILDKGRRALSAAADALREKGEADGTGPGTD